MILPRLIPTYEQWSEEGEPIKVCQIHQNFINLVNCIIRFADKIFIQLYKMTKRYHLLIFFINCTMITADFH